MSNTTSIDLDHRTTLSRLKHETPTPRIGIMTTCGISFTGTIDSISDRDNTLRLRDGLSRYVIDLDDITAVKTLDSSR